MMRRLAITAFTLALAACAPSSQEADNSATASPSPSATVSPASTTAVPAPGTAPKPSTSIAPSPEATLAPGPVSTAPVSSSSPAVPPSPSSASPTASSTPVVVNLDPDARPKIVNVSLNETTVRGGDTVSGEVVTSSNVASVEIRIAGFSMSMPKMSPGHFALSYTVPNLPFFLHKTYDMNVIARNTRGDQAVTTLPIAVH